MSGSAAAVAQGHSGRRVCCCGFSVLTQTHCSLSYRPFSFVTPPPFMKETARRFHSVLCSRFKVFTSDALMQVDSVWLHICSHQQPHTPLLFVSPHGSEWKCVCCFALVLNEVTWGLRTIRKFHVTIEPPVSAALKCKRPIRVYHLPALDEVWQLCCAPLKLMQSFQVFRFSGWFCGFRAHLG